MARCVAAIGHIFINSLLRSGLGFLLPQRIGARWTAPTTVSTSFFSTASIFSASVWTGFSLLIFLKKNLHANFQPQNFQRAVWTASEARATHDDVRAGPCEKKLFASESFAPDSATRKVLQAFCVQVKFLALRLNLCPEIWACPSSDGPRFFSDTPTLHENHILSGRTEGNMNND